MKRFVLSVLLTAAAAWPVCAAADVDGTRPPPRNVGLDQRLELRVPPDLPFHDEAGRLVTLGDYFGDKPLVMVVVPYRSPQPSAKVLVGLVHALRQIPARPGTDFEVVAVRLDPRETPEMAAEEKAVCLERYDRPRTAGGWHFLTGQRAAIDRLAGAVGFRYSYYDQTDEFTHAGGVFVLAPRGRVARYFHGVRYSSHDLRQALDEVAEKTGCAPIDRFPSYRPDYDAVTRKYSASLTALIEAGAMLSMLGLGTFAIVGRLRLKNGKAAR